MFVTFEGGEGSGKTTVAKEVRHQLLVQGESVLLTREPGGTSIAEEIRQLVLYHREEEMDPRTEVLLFAAARREHLVKKIRPALEAGKIVICDRYIDSSIVYQGMHEQTGGSDKVREVNQYAIEGELPDLTFFFDLPVEKGMERVAQRPKMIDRYDSKDLQFYETIQHRYSNLLKSDAGRFIRLDATQSIEELATEVTEIIQRKRVEFND